MRKLGPVTIDPRRHDAVLFDTTLDATQELVRQLQEVGVGTGVFGSGLDVPIVAAGVWRCGRAGAWSSRPTRRASRPHAKADLR